VLFSGATCGASAFSASSCGNSLLAALSSGSAAVLPALSFDFGRRKLIDLDQSKAASTGRFIRMLAIPLTGLRTCPPDRKVLPWKRSPNWLKKYLIKSLTL